MHSYLYTQAQATNGLSAKRNSSVVCAVTAPTDTDHVSFLDREDLLCQLQADVTGASRRLAVQQGNASSGPRGLQQAAGAPAGGGGGE